MRKFACFVTALVGCKHCTEKNAGCGRARSILLWEILKCFRQNKNRMLHSIWLEKLVQPIVDSRIHYSYGRQIGGEESYFSENRIFGKYFPEKDKIPQNDYYCNNANSALLKSVWKMSCLLILRFIHFFIYALYFFSLFMIFG